jgi:hypothetical protein
MGLTLPGTPDLVGGGADIVLYVGDPAACTKSPQCSDRRPTYAGSSGAYIQTNVCATRRTSAA